MKKTVVVAGTILADVVKTVEQYPEKGMLAPISDVRLAVGGCVPNTAIDLKKIDPAVTVRAAGCVGGDDYGEYVVREMLNAGLDVTHVKRTPLRTSFSDVVTVRKTGERTFFHYEGANAEFGEDELSAAADDCDLLHVGYATLLKKLDRPEADHGTVLAKVLKAAQERGIQTSIDCVSSTEGEFRRVVVPALRYCSYAILNEIESAAVSGIPARDGEGRLCDENIVKTMRYFLQCGVGEKVVIHAPEAGYLMDRTGRAFKVPSLALPNGFIKGCVGAGDAFCAGALYALLRGSDDAELLRFAAAAAASSLSAYDSVSGMGDKAEIQSLDSRYRTEQGVQLC